MAGRYNQNFESPQSHHTHRSLKVGRYVCHTHNTAGYTSQTDIEMTFNECKPNGNYANKIHMNYN